MMRSNRAFPLFLALSAALVAHPGPGAVAADDVTLEDMAQDILAVEIQLNVNYQVQHRYPAGDPPTTARDVTEISFRSSGVYTLIRLKDRFGGRYMAVPGFLTNPQFPQVTGISVYETHTCLSNEGFIIGRASKDLSASAEVHPASGDLLLLCEGECPDDRVRINLGYWEMRTDHVPCTTQPHCWDERTFHFAGNIGEDREAWVETEEGHLEYPGLQLAVLDWSLIKSVAEGGELPLLIPLAVTHVQHTADEGAPREGTLELLSVTGVIAPADEIPLAPLAPPAQGD